MSSFENRGRRNNDKQKHAILTNSNTVIRIAVTYFITTVNPPFKTLAAETIQPLLTAATKRKTMAEAIEITRINDLVERIGNLRRYL
jgi:hypothetical protein